MSSETSPSAAAHDGSITPTRIRPQKIHYLGVAFLFLLVFIALGFSTPWLYWTPLVPLLYIVWIERVRTTISESGISATYLFRPEKFMSWDDFRGILFDKRGRGIAVSKDDEDPDKATRFALPAVSFNSLPELSKVTGGRIPDPITAGIDARDEQVEVFDREGYSVLKDKSEVDSTQVYTEHVKRPEAPGRSE